MTKTALVKAGVDKATAKEVAHYSSTYADHPSKVVLALNKVLAPLAGVNPNELGYRKENAEEYKRMENSQSTTDTEMLTVHATKGAEEGITNEEAVVRAEAGAMGTLEKYQGENLSELSKDQKMEIGVALHQLQDIGAHKGATWAKGKKNEHSMMNDMFGSRKETRQNLQKVVQQFIGKKKDEEQNK